VLRRVLAGAGMDVKYDFVAKADANKPDLIVRLPNGRSLIVDAMGPAQFPADADTPASSEVNAQANAYAAGLGRAIEDLPQKNYSAQFPEALDHVVFFLPEEGMLSAVLAAAPDLMSTAAKHGVMLATPASLQLILQAFGMMWRDRAVADNAREIVATADAIAARLGEFTQNMSEFRARLKQTVSAPVLTEIGEDSTASAVGNTRPAEDRR